MNTTTIKPKHLTQKACLILDEAGLNLDEYD